EMRVDPRQIEEAKLAQFSKQGRVGLEVMNESGEIGFASLNEGKRHDPGRGLRLLEEHREAIYEISNGGLNRAAAKIRFRGQMTGVNLQVAAEKGDFVALRFQVGKTRICEHEIKNGDADLDVFKF